MDNIQSCEFTAEVESKCKQPVQTIYSRSRTRKAALVSVMTNDVKRSPAHIISYNLPSFSHTLSNSKNAVSCGKLSGQQHYNNASLSTTLEAGFKTWQPGKGIMEFTDINSTTGTF